MDVKGYVEDATFTAHDYRSKVYADALAICKSEMLSQQFADYSTKMVLYYYPTYKAGYEALARCIDTCDNFIHNLSIMIHDHKHLDDLANFYSAMFDKVKKVRSDLTDLEARRQCLMVIVVYLQQGIRPAPELVEGCHVVSKQEEDSAGETIASFLDALANPRKRNVH